MVRGRERGKRRRHGKWRVDAGVFYLGDAEEVAEGASGQDDRPPASDMAKLRRQLRELMLRKPGDVRAMMRTAEVMIRAARAEHRMGGGAGQGTVDRMRAVMEQLEAEMWPDGGPEREVRSEKVEE